MIYKSANLHNVAEMFETKGVEAQGITSIPLEIRSNSMIARKLTSFKPQDAKSNLTFLVNLLTPPWK